MFVKSMIEACVENHGNGKGEMLRGEITLNQVKYIDLFVLHYISQTYSSQLHNLISEAN